MTTISFEALIEKAIQDAEFGNRLIGFAKAHGVEMLTDEELSADQLDDVAGGISKSMDGAAIPLDDAHLLRYTLTYTPTLLPLPGGQFLQGGQFSG